MTFQIAVMLIEHDMNLVMGICEGICVLNYGRIIAKGTRGGDPVRTPWSSRPTWASKRRSSVSENRKPLLQVEDINVYYGSHSRHQGHLL